MYMSITDVITACGAAIAAFTIIITVVLYQKDQHQQRAARTREALQGIISDCGRFLHPLSEDAPYPILHTSASIIKEFRSNLGASCQASDVLARLHNSDLLLSICVEGWVSSTEILRMMNIVDELEHKASSHNLGGKLQLICQSSFLLAGMVAKVCSPTAFYDIMKGLDPECCKNNTAQVLMDELAIELQKGLCQAFNVQYKEVMKQCLVFIQIAARAFLHVSSDPKLVRLGKGKVKEVPLHTPTGNEKDETNDNPVQVFERETSLPNRVIQVREGLRVLEGKIDKQKHASLRELIEMMSIACIAL